MAEGVGARIDASSAGTAEEDQSFLEFGDGSDVRLPQKRENQVCSALSKCQLSSGPLSTKVGAKDLKNTQVYPGQLGLTVCSPTSFRLSEMPRSVV